MITVSMLVQVTEYMAGGDLASKIKEGDKRYVWSHRCALDLAVPPNRRWNRIVSIEVLCASVKLQSGKYAWNNAVPAVPVSMQPQSKDEMEVSRLKRCMCS